MKKFLSNPVLLGILKLILGFVFVVASLGKIIDPQGFAKDVYSYAILPAFFVPFFAAVIPWIEFISGLLLLLDIYPKSNSFIINGLLIVFIVAIFIDVLRGIEISCGCFDFLFPEEEIGWATIARDLILLVIGTIIMFFDHNEIKLFGLIKNDR